MSVKPGQWPSTEGPSIMPVTISAITDGSVTFRNEKGRDELEGEQKGLIFQDGRE